VAYLFNFGKLAKCRQNCTIWQKDSLTTGRCNGIWTLATGNWVGRDGKLPCIFWTVADINTRLFFI